MLTCELCELTSNPDQAELPRPPIHVSLSTTAVVTQNGVTVGHNVGPGFAFLQKPNWPVHI